MSLSDPTQTDDPTTEGEPLDAVANQPDEAEESPKLDLTVDIGKKSACERHITVSVSRGDIDRYFKEAFDELMAEAVVPGFRAGRAPRKLVESRFRKEVAGQVKGSLLVDSIGQLTEESSLSPISEPDFDPVAIEIPDEGAMTFEFDLEVRPEFDVPEWKGLKLERPVKDFTDEDVEKQLQDVLARHGQLVPFDGKAKKGDYVVCNLTFKNGDDEISSVEEEVIRIRPTLSFRDGRIEKFDKLLAGVTAGETREGTAVLTEDAPNEALRGKKVTAVFEVLEVKKLELPEMTPSLLEEIGGFESEEELRKAIRESLEGRLDYDQRQRVRQQILAALTVSADWDLPPALLRRQATRELERSLLELRRSGFSESEIRAHANELRQNSLRTTAGALKEHFVLERIAEDEGITDDPQDYDVEIALIARQSGESMRRVRAQLEKRGLMDSLRNQIIERKVIGLIMEHAKFTDVPYKPEESDSEAVDRSAGGDDEESEAIPQAKYSGEAESLPEPKERD